MSYHVIIVGGGPAGLSSALALGRARKRVLLCDAGPRRNAAAERIHNFVTRDGTPPDEFRCVGRKQLAGYPNVEIRDARIERISGSKGAFQVKIDGDDVLAHRVLLCTGMVDEMLPIEGFREAWGHGIFQCPYCHGWEMQDRPWGYLATNSSHFLPFSLQLCGWSSQVVVFTHGAFEVASDAREKLESAGVRIETLPIARIVSQNHTLEAVELSNGTRVACEALYAHPPQHQVDLVRALDLTLDADGFVQVDPMKRETSVPGIYAAGDLATRMQGAIMAAATGTQAAAMLNLELTLSLIDSAGASQK